VTPETEDDFHDVSALPDGRGVLFVLHRKGPAGVDFDTIEVFAGKTRKTVIRMEGQNLRHPVYSPSGHVLFNRSPTNPGVWAVPFSPDTLEATGQPFLVAAGGREPTVSGGGTLVYVQGSTGRPRQMVRVSRDGAARAPIGSLAETSPVMALSPDGSRVVISIEEHGKQDLWVHDLTRGTRTRLTFGIDAGMPAWSPDGTRVVFTRGTNTADFTLMLAAADGTGQPEELAPGWFPQFTPDGDKIVYNQVSEAGPAGLWWMPLEGERRATHLPQGQSNQIFPAVSPDGRHIAYASSETGRWEIYLRPFPTGDGRWQVSVDGGMWPHWSRSGDRLFFAQGDDLMEVALTTVPAPRLGQPQKVLTRGPSGVDMPFNWPPGFDVFADGESFVFLETPNAGPSVTKLGVVLNWFEEFRR